MLLSCIDLSLSLSLSLSLKAMKKKKKVKKKKWSLPVFTFSNINKCPEWPMLAASQVGRGVSWIFMGPSFQ